MNVKCEITFWADVPLDGLGVGSKVRIEGPAVVNGISAPLIDVSSGQPEYVTGQIQVDFFGHDIQVKAQ